MNDLYLVLGLTHTATSDEIKAAYRDKIRFFHPDHWLGDPAMGETALQRTKDLNEAYAILSDPARRAAYDRGQLQPGAARRSAPTWERPRRPANPDAVRRQYAAARASLFDAFRRFKNLPRGLLVIILVPAVAVTVVVIAFLLTVLVEQSIAPTATPTPPQPATPTLSVLLAIRSGD